MECAESGKPAKSASWAVAYPLDRLYLGARYGATWRSGYAAVCKTVYTSSILVVASSNFNDLDWSYRP